MSVESLFEISKLFEALKTFFIILLLFLLFQKVTDRNGRFTMVDVLQELKCKKTISQALCFGQFLG